MTTPSPFDNDDDDDDISLVELNDVETYSPNSKEEEEKEDADVLAAFLDDDDSGEMSSPVPVNLSSLKSSFQWTKAMLKSHIQHEGILQKFENQSSTMSMRGLYEHTGMSDADPINIICMDGGGMKGYCHTAVVDELQKMMGSENEEEDDLMQYFDLSCGTSVGGIAALMQGHHGTKQGFHKDASLLLDQIRERSFKRLSGWSLFLRGSLTTGQDQIAHILEDFYGDTPLYNPGGLRAFALCTTRKDHGPNKPATFEPFVLRSYALRDKDKDNAERSDNYKRVVKRKSTDKVDFKVDGTSDVLLWEAMAATSAAPVLTDRVQLTLNGEKKQFADGCIVSNSPVVVAMAEARRLWPKRPFGVILMLGLGNDHESLIERAMEAAKMDSPDMQYLRLVPPIEEFSPAETDPERIRQMQQVAVENVKKSSVQVKALLSKLKLSGSRRSQKAAKTSTEKSRMSVWTARTGRRRKSMLAPRTSMVKSVARRMAMRYSVKLDLTGFDRTMIEEESDERVGLLRISTALYFLLFVISFFGYYRYYPGFAEKAQTCYEDPFSYLLTRFLEGNNHNMIVR